MSENKVGKVYSCGYGFFGQCGVGDTKSHKELVQVKVLENVVIMKCGDSFCVAVDKDNNVYTWGSNRFGQCAILPFGNYTTPVRIDTLSSLKVSTIACGTSHCVLALTSGEVYSFGSGTEGRLGLGDDGPRYEPCKIEAFGSIKIVGVSAGMLFSVAVSDKGKVYSWGANRYGQLGIPALKTHKSPQKVTSLDSMFIDKVACGRSHTLVVTDRGTVFGFGHNMCGQLGDKTTTDAHLPRMAGFPPGVKTYKIACGYYHSLCLTLDGSVYSWGYNAEGALGLGAVMGHQNVPHSLSHTLKNILLPGETITEIKAAGWHSALVTSEKRVLTFGLGDTNRLGHGNEEDRRFPKVVEGISVKDVECAGANTFFITG